MTALLDSYWRVVLLPSQISGASQRSTWRESQVLEGRDLRAARLREGGAHGQPCTCKAAVGAEDGHHERADPMTDGLRILLVENDDVDRIWVHRAVRKAASR